MSADQRVDITHTLGTVFEGNRHHGKARQMRFVLSLLALGSGMFLAAAVASYTVTVSTKERVVTVSGERAGKDSQVRYASVSETCADDPRAGQCTGPWNTVFGPIP